MNRENYSLNFEVDGNRQKLTIPVKRNWLLVSLHSIALLVWLGMLITVLVYLIRGLSSNLVLTILLMIWLVIWLWFGRFLWSRWQFQFAEREIIFFDSEQLIIRRPISILGITTVYDIKHVGPFYYSDRHACPAFDYAFLHVYFGQSLNSEEARRLVGELNKRIFPDLVVD